ncbi:uncharacterized protein RAG0_13022 [Rhynchosporium agropyri]|uniref:Uncharacterized protein n=1 Tax=Rhynchosporium agropyri TaxID=914238 RepID=A0A1E1LAY2_9HELO|nr:uncharacterized protein RAG0_13022 [Rhynchosporium agropyri]
MSRAFSSTTELLKRKVGNVIAGEIRGNPHPTPHQKGRNDPFHGSGAIGRTNLKRDNRETSLHIYPNGPVKPTNEKWPTLQVTAAAAEELGRTQSGLIRTIAKVSHWEHGEGKDKGKGKDKVSEVAEDSLSSGGGSSGWQWDNEMQMNKRWANDLESYVYWDESARAEKYWDGTDWKWVK